MSFRSRAHFLLLLLRLAAQNVGRRPLRSVFLGLAIMIAVGVGFSGAVLGWSLRDGILRSFSRMGADMVIVPHGAMVNLTSTLLTVQPTELELDLSLGETLRRIPGVAAAAPQRLARAAVEGRSIPLIAYDPQLDFTVEPWLADGPLHPGADALLVGERAPQKPGETISICGATMTIVGRLNHTGVGPFDESYFVTFAGLDRLIEAARRTPLLARQPAPTHEASDAHPSDAHHGDHMHEHRSAAPARCLADLALGKASAFLVRLSAGASPEQARFAIGQIPEIKVVSGNAIFTAARQSLASLLWGVGAFAALLILALLFVVTLLFSAIVQERYREIGMLRAMGARPGQIIAVTLLEAGLVTGAGGVAGIAFGASLIFLAARSLGFHFASSGVPFGGPPDAFILAAGLVCLCFGLALGVFGALLASRRAMRLEPALMIQMESAR